MNPAYRLLRVALAAATLHLTMALPAHACEHMERTAAPAPDMMSHVGHEMPAPEAPAKQPGQQQPCCPTMPAGCTSAACATPAVEAVSVSTAPTTFAVAAPHAADGRRWLSVPNSPEPPPPRI